MRREPRKALRGQPEGHPRRARLVAGGAIASNEAAHDGDQQDGASQSRAALSHDRDPGRSARSPSRPIVRGHPSAEGRLESCYRGRAGFCLELPTRHMREARSARPHRAPLAPQSSAPRTDHLGRYALKQQVYADCCRLKQTIVL